MSREYFRILAPFTTSEDVQILKDAGADELYCGYVTEELTKSWPLAFNILNRRGEGQSFENDEEFKKAVGQANNYQMPVYVTINGLYTPEQYPLLFELVKKIEDLEGVKGIIIADFGFLLFLRKNKFKKEIHISGGGNSFNANTVDFYQNLGADRVILPRELTSHEIGNILTEIQSKIDIEIFVIFEPCGGFIDGLCTFFHCFGKNDVEAEEIKKNYSLQTSYNTEQENRGCMFYFSKLSLGEHVKVFSRSLHKERKNSLKFQIKKYSASGCRICDLHNLKKYPIKSLKIIGRGSDAQYIAKSVKFISKILFYLESGGFSEKEYTDKCKDLFSMFFFNGKRRCTKFDCYFSTHWVRHER